MWDRGLCAAPLAAAFEGTDTPSELAPKAVVAEATAPVEGSSPAEQIVETARRCGADLIVIGSRERHGPSILVNLTEDTVLHAAPCDVLAVRLR